MGEETILNGRETDVLLSVVVPTKNRAALVKRVIRVFASFPAEVEVFVVDDGSDPDCAEIVASFCNEQPNAKYIRCLGATGAASARNLGHRVSRADYVWFFDDDDYVDSNTVAQLLRRIRNEPSPREIILLPMSVRHDGLELYRVDPSATEHSFERYRSHGSVVNPSCTVFPRQVLDAIGGWDEQIGGGDDTDLFLRCSKLCQYHCLDSEAVHVNVGHSGRFSDAVWLQERSRFRFLVKHWADLSLRRKLHYAVGILLWTPLLNRLFFVSIRAPIMRRLLRQKQR